MTKTIAEASLDRVQRVAEKLQTQLNGLQPLLKQMHLLSSNAVSSAARAGTEGDAFRILTQAIQQLGQDINAERSQALSVAAELLTCQQVGQLKPLARQLDNAVSALPIALRKGEYLAICCSVEAAHADMHSESFDSVANMLKQLVDNLRKQINQLQKMVLMLNSLL